MHNKILLTTITALLAISIINCDKNDKKNSKTLNLDTTSKASIQTSEEGGATGNLVKNAQSWIPAHDEFGSSYDTINAILSDTLKQVHFKLNKKTDKDKWPYIELISKIGNNLEGKKIIKLKYTCSKPLILKLSQSDFNDKGNKTYSHYQYTVDKTSEFKEVTLNLSDFKQPDWTPDISKSIPLKLENVDAVYFTPDVDAEVGGEADLSLSEFYIH